MKKKFVFAAAFLGLIVTLGLKSEMDLDFDRHPDATVDLATCDGVQLVKSQWHYSDARIVETDFQAAGADGPAFNYTGEDV